MRQLGNKYWKFFGLTIVLSMLAASILEWTISNEQSGNIVQCEEVIDFDSQIESEGHSEFQFVLGSIDFSQYFDIEEYRVVHRIEMLNAAFARLKLRSFMILNHQFKFAC